MSARKASPLSFWVSSHRKRSLAVFGTQEPPAEEAALAGARPGGRE